MTKASRSILIIAENTITADLQRSLLINIADNIKCVATAKQGLAELSNRSYSIVITDYILPDGNCMAVVDAANRQHPKVPTIVATKLSQERVATDAIRHGAADYQTKGQNNWEELLASAIRILRLTEMEQELVRSLEIQASVLNALPSNIALLNLSGEIITVNKAWKDFAPATGIDSENFGIGSNYVELVRRQKNDSLSAQHVGRGISGVLQGEMEEFFSEYSVRRDNSTQWYRMTVTPFLQHTVAGAVVMHANITDAKIAEEALSKTEEQLRQSQKIEAVGQLAGGVAHDFNNQLGVILGYADMLRQSVTQPNLKHFADNICAAAQRSAALTRNLLAFARKGQYKAERVDLHTIINETIEMLARSIDKRISISRIFRTNAAYIVGDPSQVQNALLNLGLNARDAMPDGGSLTITTETMELDGTFDVVSRGDIPEGQYICISVSDTGLGMSEEVKKHLFEPFFTTKPIGKGTGMGLASVYGTVKIHKGAVSVYSELGHGTKFRLYFPVAMKATPITKCDVVSIKFSKRLRILVVDDEEILLTMFNYMLNSDGHHVREAANGRLALEVYKQHWKEIDLVILDMVMPEMGGRDTYRALKAINPRVKTLLASGFSMNSEIQSMLDDGVLGFIEKPFDRNQLLSAVHKAYSETMAVPVFA